jgi:GYF domain 2
MNDRGTLGGFTRDDGSFSETDQSTNFENPTYDDWYYVEHGEKKGPISAVAVKSLLNSKEIAGDTYVWRKGMKDWCTIRESDLYGFVDNIPPPISSNLIGNAYVWIMAFLPIIFAVIDASVGSYNQDEAARFWSLGFTPHPINADVALKIFAPINGLFALLDFQRLKKAGYATWQRGLLAFFLPVVYLFIRAKLLKQRPYYAIVWIAMFVLGVLIDSN